MGKIIDLLKSQYEIQATIITLLTSTSFEIQEGLWIRMDHVYHEALHKY